MMSRHPGTEHLLRFFDSRHLPAGPSRDIAGQLSTTALDMAAQLPDGPELTTGLRKLLEAKDCFVRASLDLKEDRA